MLGAILSFTKCILDFTLFFWFSTQFFKLRWKKRAIVPYVVILCLAIFIYLINFFLIPELNTLIAFTCAVIINFLLFDGGIIARLLCAIIEVLSIVICEFIPIAIYSYTEKINMAVLTNETIKNAGFNMISTGLLSIIILIVRHIITLKWQRDNKEITISENISILTVPLVSIFIIYYILYIHSTSMMVNDEVSMISLFAFMGILVMNMIVIMGDNNLRKQYHLQMELDRLNQREELNCVLIEQQDQYIDELKGFAHDYAKQIEGIKKLVLTKDVSISKEIHIYFEEMQTQIKDCYRFAFIPSPALRTILSQAQLHCNSNHILFEVDIQYAEFSFIAFPDLYTLFENPLDNAITACKQITNQAIEKKIQLVMFIKRNMIWVTIKNTMINSIVIKNNCIQTTKKNPAMHGLGIKNMKRVIARYGGHLSIEYTANEFSIIMAFPAPLE